ncbi:hypothetical protein GCM10009665_37810 [Kitasatospora nipponensis]|uniref:Uncharacterized protein n=2 Tax=Kitasatospora nipponensis TaxID=258049 RepID=A0ABN1WEP7_9ACTN
MALTRGGSPVDRVTAAKVRLTGGWVHLEVTGSAGAGSVTVCSVPADAVVRVSWTATVEEVASRHGSILGPHN